MTSVHAASLKSVKKGQLYMPFSIRLSKILNLIKDWGISMGVAEGICWILRGR